MKLKIRVGINPICLSAKVRVFSAIAIGKGVGSGPVYIRLIFRNAAGSGKLCPSDVAGSQCDRSIGRACPSGVLVCCAFLNKHESIWTYFCGNNLTSKRCGNRRIEIASTSILKNIWIQLRVSWNINAIR